LKPLNSNISLNIVVIGGGAAGFFGAVTCAKTHLHCHVTLLEAGQTPLAKVKISGGGRCNVTHACFDPGRLVQSYPRGGKALRGAFSRFQPRDTVAWFRQQGVQLKTEADGRMFPITDDSQTIIDCLTDAARDAGVKLRTATAVKSVQKTPKGFEIGLRLGEAFTADRVLLATGSNPAGYRWAEALGHRIQSPVPSLFTFNIQDPRLNNLAGVSVENVQLRLKAGKTKLEQAGALLITHWGISGPGVLKLSAWGARLLYDHDYNLPLVINWLPEENPETLLQKFLTTKEEFAKRKVVNHNPTSLPKRLWQSLLIAVGVDAEQRWAGLGKKQMNQLVQELTQGQYQIQGKGIFKEEFVTCGGVTLKEVNFKTMESKQCPGLYFAGEILDIDGITGGFNFQNAWTTAWLAGHSLGAIPA
jgi:predicted Rossmann fold flavoprotein